VLRHTPDPVANGLAPGPVTGWRRRDQLRGVQAPPGCGARDRCGPAGESMS